MNFEAHMSSNIFKVYSDWIALSKANELARQYVFCTEGSKLEIKI